MHRLESMCQFLESEMHRVGNLITVCTVEVGIAFVFALLIVQKIHLYSCEYVIEDMQTELHDVLAK